MKRFLTQAASVRPSVAQTFAQRMVGTIALLVTSATQAHHGETHSPVAVAIDHLVHPFAIAALLVAVGVGIIIRLRSQD